MKNNNRHAEQRIEIKNSEDLNYIISDMFHEFLESLINKDWAIRPPEEDDEFDTSGFDFVYTSSGMDIIERYRSRMGKLFHKNFPEGNFHIFSPLFIES
jgi:hypothetical protein